MNDYAIAREIRFEMDNTKIYRQYHLTILFDLKISTKM